MKLVLLGVLILALVYNAAAVTTIGAQNMNLQITKSDGVGNYVTGNININTGATSDTAQPISFYLTPNQNGISFGADSIDIAQSGSFTADLFADSPSASAIAHLDMSNYCCGADPTTTIFPYLEADVLDNGMVKASQNTAIQGLQGSADAKTSCQLNTNSESSFVDAQSTDSAGFGYLSANQEAITSQDNDFQGAVAAQSSSTKSLSGTSSVTSQSNRPTILHDASGNPISNAYGPVSGTDDAYNQVTVTNGRIGYTYQGEDNTWESLTDDSNYQEEPVFQVAVAGDISSGTSAGLSLHDLDAQMPDSGDTVTMDTTTFDDHTFDLSSLSNICQSGQVSLGFYEGAYVQNEDFANLEEFEPLLSGETVDIKTEAAESDNGGTINAALPYYQYDIPISNSETGIALVGATSLAYWGHDSSGNAVGNGLIAGSMRGC